MQVVVIDDDAPLRRAIVQYLRAFGITVAAEAGTGRAGLSVLQRVRVDLIITDCQMPGMDGITMVRTLRQRGDLTPVIMISAQSDPQVIAVARRAGINRYLSKPFAPELLAEAIQELANLPIPAAYS